MQTLYRNPIAQQFDHFKITVPVTPTRIQLSSQAQSLEVDQYDALILSVPVAAAHPIYFGGPTVVGGLSSNGLQVRQGIPVMLSINSTRQLVELQAPLVDTLPALGGMACEAPLIVPRIVWDVSNLWLTADIAPVDCAVLLFRAML